MSALGQSRRTKPSNGFVRCLLCPESGQTGRRLAKSALCRYCCKSLFALVIKNSPGRIRDFRVKMWRTSSPDDKLTGDLGNVIETT